MRLIKLTRGLFAKVDDENYFWLNLWGWCALKSKGTFYAVRNDFDINGKRITISMHRQILGLTNDDSGLVGDHENGDGLDNQRNNLRIATKSQNTVNRKKFKNKYLGVSKNGIYWSAECTKDGKKHRRFCMTEDEAALKYNELATELHGEFAKLNVVG